MTTLLNGFQIEFSASTFSAYASELKDPEELKALRAKEAGQ